MPLLRCGERNGRIVVVIGLSRLFLAANGLPPLLSEGPLPRFAQRALTSLHKNGYDTSITVSNPT
jgi:hypothetical protein